MNLKRWLKKQVIAYSLLLLSGSAIALEKAPGACEKFTPLTFGILPFISAEQLVERFAPLSHHLTKYLNAPIRIETAPDFVEFARRTHQGKRYDILFTAPHMYPKAREKAAYTLVASVDSPGMRVVIVSPRKSSINNLTDLKGKRLAMVQPTSLAALMTIKHLKNNGLNPEQDLEMVTTPTHDASLLSSYHGVTDASALMQSPYEAASDQVKSSMRIISKTESMPHIPISVSPRISKDCATEISALLLKMNSTVEGKRILKHNRFAGFRKSKDEEYEHIKTLFSRQGESK